MVDLFRFSQLSLLLAFFFFPLRHTGTLDAPTLKLSELFLFFSFLFLCGAFVRHPLRLRLLLRAALFKTIAVLWVIFLLLVIGTLISVAIQYDNLPLRFIAEEYVRFSMAGLFLLLTLFHSLSNNTFIGPALFSLSSSVLLGSFLLFPTQAHNLGLVDDLRFEGLSGDPNYLAGLLLIGLSTFLAYLFFTKRSTAQQIILFFASTISVALLLWTGSRSGMLGFLAAMLTLLLFSARQSNHAFQKCLLSFLSIALISTAGLGAYTVLTKQNIVQQRLEGALQNIPQLTTNYRHNERAQIWTQALSFAQKNPFGYGPGYARIVDIQTPGAHHRVAHNFALESLLTGGVVLLSILLVAISTLVLHIVQTNDRSANSAAVSAALAGLITTALFLDALTLRWLWVLMGLMIALHAHHNSLRSTAHILVEKLVPIKHAR